MICKSTVETLYNTIINSPQLSGWHVFAPVPMLMLPSATDFSSHSNFSFLFILGRYIVSTFLISYWKNVGAYFHMKGFSDIRCTLKEFLIMDNMVLMKVVFC